MLIKKKHEGDEREAIIKHYRDPKNLAELSVDLIAMAEALDDSGKDIGVGMRGRVKKHKKNKLGGANK